MFKNSWDTEVIFWNFFWKSSQLDLPNVVLMSEKLVLSEILNTGENMMRMMLQLHTPAA